MNEEIIKENTPMKPLNAKYPFFLSLLKSEFPEWQLKWSGVPLTLRCFLFSSEKNKEISFYFVIENNLQKGNGAVSFEELLFIKKTIGTLQASLVLSSEFKILLGNVDDKLELLPYSLEFQTI